MPTKAASPEYGVKAQIALAVVFIVAQARLDLTLPDHMAAIATPAEPPGSTTGVVLEQGGRTMLCALGPMAANVVATLIAARAAAGLGRTLRSRVSEHAPELSKGDTERLGAASLVNRLANETSRRSRASSPWGPTPS